MPFTQMIIKFKLMQWFVLFCACTFWVEKNIKNNPLHKYCPLRFLSRNFSWILRYMRVFSKLTPSRTFQIIFFCWKSSFHSWLFWGKAFFIYMKHVLVGRKQSTKRSTHPEVFLEKGVLKLCSKFYRRTPMPKCEFSCKFTAYFQNSFS